MPKKTDRQGAIILVLIVIVLSVIVTSFFKYSLRSKVNKCDDSYVCLTHLFSKRAIEKDDIEQCSHESLNTERDGFYYDVPIKNDCLLEFYVETMHPINCTYFSDVKFCGQAISEVALKNLDVSKCDDAGSWKGRCIYQIAHKLNDINTCYKIPLNDTFKILGDRYSVRTRDLCLYEKNVNVAYPVRIIR